MDGERPNRLGNGGYTAQVTQLDAAGNTGQSTPAPYTLSDRPRRRPSVTGPTDGSMLNSSNPVFNGTAGTDPGDSQTITLSIYAGTTTGGRLVAYQTTSRSGSTWLLSNWLLQSGTYTAEASQADVAGNVGQSTPVTFTISAPDQTALSGYETASTISPGHGAWLYGYLTDQSTGLPLAGRLVTVVNKYRYKGNWRSASLRAVTNSSGVWEVWVTTSRVPTRLFWHASYTGETGIGSAYAGARTLYVRPKLTIGSSAQWTGYAFRVKPGASLTLQGSTEPNMLGVTLTVQYKRPGGRWHSRTTHPIVALPNSRYRTRLSMPGTGRYYLRVTRTGSGTGQWLSAKSAARLLIISP